MGNDGEAELQEDTTDEGASKTFQDLSWIDLTEPDPKHNGAEMRNERLASIWKEQQGNEMTGLFGCCCLKRSSEASCPWARGSSPPAMEDPLLDLLLQDQVTLCGRAQTEG
jgi:hypothetical protein